MLRGAPLIPQNVPGYGLSDNGCSSISISAFKLSSSYSSHNDYTSCKVLPSRRIMSFICNSSSNGERRNPDFPRKTRHRFSQNKNTHNESKSRDNNRSHEKTETFFSKSTLPLLSNSSFPRLQDTSTTGPKEQEILELFQKVQIQLRERTALKEEETKVKDSQESDINKTGDSLINLLRKHSTQYNKTTNSFASNNNVKNEVEDNQDMEVRTVIRPVSNFKRRSPVPQFKYQLILSGKDSEHDNKLNSETKFEPVVNVSDDEIEMSEDQEKVSEESDLRRMKVVELRAVAKSRGLKGVSKMKKQELFELLTV